MPLNEEIIVKSISLDIESIVGIVERVEFSVNIAESVSSEITASVVDQIYVKMGE